MNFLLDSLEAEVVGGAVDVAPLDAAAGQPHGELIVRFREALTIIYLIG
jgi:hypothetical protein